MPRYISLTDAVTRAKRADGTHIIPIEHYYKERIAAIDQGNFGAFLPSQVRNKRGICPFHEDQSPSMGILSSNDGRERFNCFGCRAWGHVVDLHRKIEAQYHNRRLSLEEAAADLLSSFGIDSGIFEPYIVDPKKQLTTEEKLTRDARRARDALAIHKRFGVEDYRRLLLTGVVEKKGTAYFNSLLHQMTAETKDPLEDLQNRGEYLDEDSEW